MPSGVVVDFAYNAAQACARLQAQSFDLVVLDVVMPRLSGREALDRMRSRRPNLKVLFVTGYAPESTGISEALTDPELDLLRKPFTSSELAERVRAVLERR